MPHLEAKHLYKKVFIKKLLLKINHKSISQWVINITKIRQIIQPVLKMDFGISTKTIMVMNRNKKIQDIQEIKNNFKIQMKMVHTISRQKIISRNKNKIFSVEMMKFMKRK